LIGERDQARQFVSEERSAKQGLLAELIELTKGLGEKENELRKTRNDAERRYQKVYEAWYSHGIKIPRLTAANEALQKQYDDRRAKWDIDEKLYLEANLEILRLKTQMERDQSKYNILQDELATQTTEVAKLRDLLEETRKEKRNESANFLAQVENITRTRVPCETYNLLKEEKDNATHQLIEERADFKYRYSQLEEEKKEYQLKYERLLHFRAAQSHW